MAALIFSTITAFAHASEISVSGLGFLGNRQAKNTLELLLGEQRDAALNASAIEDASLILFSELDMEGYQRPTVTALISTSDGQQISHELNARLDKPLPRPLAAEKVELQVARGQRYTLREVEFTGLTVLTEAEAREFFLGEGVLIALPATRIYAPGRLQRSLGNLQEELRQRGYADAKVSLVEDEAIDHEKGDVRVRVKIEEGLPWRVKSLAYESTDGQPVLSELTAVTADEAWNSLWRQNTSTAIRRRYYRDGYPDVQVKLTANTGKPANGERAVNVTAEITPGQKVVFGKVRFYGNDHTREKNLRRLTRLDEGTPLDPIRVDNAQSRLGRLGVFRNIEANYEPEDGPVRDVVFDLTEGRRKDVNLLFGYGTYDQLRGGVEFNNYNVFGRAHTSSLKLVQSMKSSQGEHLYTIPELFGSSVDGSTRIFGLRREELSFLREEYGATVSLLWPLVRSTNLTTGYSFRQLRSADNELATSNTDQTQINAASIDLGLVRDRRDNPLTPRKGYKAAIHIEEASRWLGGEVDYQRLLLDASYHTSWGRTRWIHAGFTHGIITTFGAENDSELPVNVRYFPGGDGSIRGYRRGEAAPRAADGKFIGAKTYLQLNLELEQAITRKFSIVAFADALGTAAQLADYPFDERLYSVGLGIRYNTIIGPIRVEYGHNLNPRPLDPNGTVQISVGFPF
ncbi:BamA/OMP85 family outer membrane protein [Oleiharenicola lentus]|uniref:BamA/OMP85 family outer membrane protein n=1 Tax=Oleiharenicola lentus TaxID=2508720 RepID=UPI003F667A05